MYMYIYIYIYSLCLPLRLYPSQSLSFCLCLTAWLPGWLRVSLAPSVLVAKASHGGATPDIFLSFVSCKASSQGVARGSCRLYVTTCTFKHEIM